MARVCEMCKKGPTTGNLVSHSNIKTRTRWLPNLKRMKAVVAGCMKNTGRLIAGMESFGICRAATPDVNVATFICTKAMIPAPWKVSWTCRKHLRIVCMPHVHNDRIEAFLRDIGESHA